ncbi:MAG TPA: hypothetical protein VF059_13425 [Casimicrobiaceae bacterium]
MEPGPWSFRIALICALSVAHAAEAQDFTILAQPVAVAARLDSQPGDPARFFPFTLTVSHGERSFAYKTTVVGVDDSDDAVVALKRTIGWKDRYLFVRQECGGGNRWRCDIDQVFALRGDRLVHIGEQAGGTRNQGPGAFYRRGYFVDMYDRLENNDLTTHAGAPSFAIYMKDAGDSMTVDLARTWKEGRATYGRNRKDIVRIARDRGMDPRARAEALASLLLDNAVLARYCRQAKPLEQTLQDAQQLLPGERWKTFESIVERVKPGELPAPRRS